MFTGRSAMVLGGALLTVALSGCSSTSDGQAFPIEASESSASQSAKAATLPSRPAELALQSADPCALLTSPQLDELKVNSKPRAVADAPDGRTCAFDADLVQPFHAYQVRAVGADLEAWVTGTRRKNSMTTTPKMVGGFPALTNYRAAGTPADCETLVGVANGQTMAVQAFAVTTGAFTQPQLCELSAHAAELALQTLSARN
ncbi:DUF3558 domain-containing protein [Amycolatopsis sp. H20-H5]|uniref:DUF3558 domain-containing protein n=1 Tax=Amycolatopsis sp. H20-H5 TaxID=3046309 RepID=UPI002DB8B69C|nr:DUF3558 domain-containing protein [Amycolatopsis sp. H20-H5]MEC3977081.1 DUF3558 domain-containing protein [Amycolatopsis sp. H20-H5]